MLSGTASLLCRLRFWVNELVTECCCHAHYTLGELQPIKVKHGVVQSSPTCTVAARSTGCGTAEATEEGSRILLFVAPNSLPSMMSAHAVGVGREQVQLVKPAKTPSLQAAEPGSPGRPVTVAEPDNTALCAKPNVGSSKVLQAPGLLTQ